MEPARPPPCMFSTKSLLFHCISMFQDGYKCILTIHVLYAVCFKFDLCLPLIISTIHCWHGDCIVQIWHSKCTMLEISLTGLHQLEHSHLHFKCDSVPWYSYPEQHTMSAAADEYLTMLKTTKTKKGFHNIPWTTSSHWRGMCWRKKQMVIFNIVWPYSWAIVIEILKIIF